jgi:hypothetical protein
MLINDKCQMIYDQWLTNDYHWALPALFRACVIASNPVEAFQDISRLQAQNHWATVRARRW